MDNTFMKLLSHKCDIEKKKNLTYISWSEAWAELKKIDEKASYVIYENPEGLPFRESKFGIDCKVGVTLNGLEHVVRLPVMDGANKSMKFEGYEYETKFGVKKVQAATTFDINKTIQRAFTKAIAMHGLGLYVYMGEDLPEEPPKKSFGQVERDDLLEIKDKKGYLKLMKDEYNFSEEWLVKIKELLK